MSKKSRITKAIKIIQQSKSTHERWIKFYIKHPKEKIVYNAVAGNTQHHKFMIKKYNFVLAVLRQKNED